jgi:hypothetical protein
VFFLLMFGLCLEQTADNGPVFGLRLEPTADNGPVFGLRLEPTADNGLITCTITSIGKF